MTERPSRRILLAADEARVAALYQAGWSMRALALEFGVSLSPIASALKHQGITPRHTNNPKGLSAKRHRYDTLGRIIPNRSRNAHAHARSSEEAEP